MTPAEIQVKIKILRRELQWWEETLAKKSCTDCKHWQHRGCGLAEGAEPPAEVVKVGCPEWNWDQIPL